MKNQTAVRKLLENGFQRFTTFSSKEQSALANWTALVVEQYHQVLDNHQARIKDSSLLPCSKQEVKLAIKVSMLPYIIRDAQECLEALKYDYISLAMFQQIEDDDRDTFAQAIENEGDGPKASMFPPFQKYLNLALAEQNSLQDEIDSFIADMKEIYS